MRDYAAQGIEPWRALNDIIAKYGPNSHLYVVPNTETVYPGTESSNAWWDWYRTGSAKEFVENSKYESVAAFWGATNEYNLEARNQLLSNGLITPLTVDEILEKNRRSLTYRAYNNVREQLPPEGNRTFQQRLWLNQYVDELQATNDLDLNDQDAQEQRNRQMRHLQNIVADYEAGDPVVVEQMETPMGQAVYTYMAWRDAVDEEAQKRYGLLPGGWATSPRTATLRDSLRNVAGNLIDGYSFVNGQWEKTVDSVPAFGRLYSFVLENEMRVFETDGVGQEVNVIVPLENDMMTGIGGR